LYTTAIELIEQCQIITQLDFVCYYPS